MKGLFIVLFVSLFLNSPGLWSQQQVLHVKAGEKRIISKEEQNAIYTQIVFEDNSVISFAEGVTKWQLQCDKVYIGTNVTIDARGRNGVNGSRGQNAGGQSSCHQGHNGHVGGHGGSGGNGIDVSMTIKIYAIGSMKINASGGRGGNGGIGGTGGKGGSADCDKCSGGRGGTGGKGGDAGIGGRSGRVEIVYSLVSGFSPLDDLKDESRFNALYNFGEISSDLGDNQSLALDDYDLFLDVELASNAGIIILAEGGNPGTPGSGGGAGAGGDGKGGCGQWPVRWSRGGGPGGSLGLSGSVNSKGQSITPILRKI